MQHATTYSYDDQGRVKTITDPTGVVAETAYDPVGRPAVRSNTRGASWVTTYDLAGNVLSQRDPSGFATTYTYDLLNRVKTQQFGTLSKTTFNYSNVGNLLSRVQGSQTLAWEYDGRSNLTASTDARGKRTMHDYDLAGNLKKQTLPSGHTRRWDYDLAGRLTDAIDGLENISHYDYNVAGDLKFVTLPRGGVYEFTYDEVGRLDSEKPPLQAATTYDYDDEGRLERIDYPSGRAIVSTYDDAGRLDTQRAGDELRAYGYDDAGRLTSATAPSGSLSFGYDDRGLLDTSTDQLGTATYQYDGAERLTSLALATGSTTTYGYNTNGLLETVRGPSNFNYSYDSFGRPTVVEPRFPTSRGNELRSYDADGRLTKISSASSAAPFELSATYSDDGVVSSTTSTLGTLVNPDEGTATYLHDEAGRLKSRILKNGEVTVSTTTYDWDGDGNRKSVDTGSGPTMYEYDAADRLTSSSDGSTYTYDDDGNLTSTDRPGSDDVTYDYNAFGELVNVSVGGQSASFKRDGLGRVIERTSGGASDKFGYDGLSSALTAYDAANAPATSMIKTPSGGLVSLAPAGGTPQKATLNLHGDLSLLRAETTGAFTYSALFEPFGDASTTGATPAPLGFQAMATDPLSGLVDMGFRSYDPSTDRFTAADNIVGHLDFGISLNRYAYAWASPLDYFDPDGHDACSTLSFGLVDDCDDAVDKCDKYLFGACSKTGEAIDEGIDKVKDGAETVVDTATSLADTVVSTGVEVTRAAYSRARSAVQTAQQAVMPGVNVVGGAVNSAFDHATALANAASQIDMSNVHVALDVAGFVPGLGEAADGFNGVLYLLEGDTTNALISFAAMIPVAGGVGTAARLGSKYGDEAAAMARGPRAPTTSATRAKSCSFAGDTTVLMAGGSRKPISEVQAGDRVIATDPETGEQVAKEVTRVWVHRDSFVDLVVGDEVLTTTEDHPFWSVSDRRFKRADELKPGEKVLAADGRKLVISALRVGSARTAPAYNLSVKGIHTYHVGAEGVLVHNTCDVDPGPPRGPMPNLPDGYHYRSTTSGTQVVRNPGRAADLPALRLDGGQLAPGAATGFPRSSTERSAFLRQLANDPSTPKSLLPWLATGRTPPGYAVDHFRALFDRGTDVASNMRLVLVADHVNRHRFYRPGGQIPTIGGG